jgi:predicted RNA-binding Zn-ribbon protein involved in translation (DUF1610 family)
MHSPPTTPTDSGSEVVAFLKDRSHPCPRCGYDLRNAPAAICPECGEPLILKIGSPRARFGWLVLAMAPGCFSGIAACFVLIPIGGALWQGVNPGNIFPWPIFIADLFGFSSAASVYLMYRFRHHITHRPPRAQAAFAITIWAIHILMFIGVLTGMWFFG